MKPARRFSVKRTKGKGVKMTKGRKSLHTTTKDMIIRQWQDNDGLYFGDINPDIIKNVSRDATERFLEAKAEFDEVINRQNTVVLTP